MNRNRFTVEQIIRMLREAEVHLSQGKSVKLVSRARQRHQTIPQLADADQAVVSF